MTVVLIKAFGEKKSIADWSRDKRCVVSYFALTQRIRLLGMKPEKAITTTERDLKTEASKNNGKFYSAWGESKRIADWLNDPRCVVSRNNLYDRLKKGVKLEDALTIPLLSNHPADAAPRSDSNFYTAWEETKSAPQWAKDPRCKVGLVALRKRLHKGINPEKAMTASSAEMRSEKTEAGWAKRSKKYKAFGEKKTLTAWAKDPRCKSSRDKLYCRIRDGWKIEEAIITPPRGSFAWLRKNITIFSETKSITEWSQDPRCEVSYSLFAGRLWQGIDPERALKADDFRKKIVSAFGEVKSLAAWGRDERCIVSRGVFWRRARLLGMSVEDAMTTSPVGRYIVAFGERKKLGQWVKDQRCKVDYYVLWARLERGCNPEVAISTIEIDPKESMIRNFFMKSCKGELFGNTSDEAALEMLDQRIAKLSHPKLPKIPTMKSGKIHTPHLTSKASHSRIE